MYKIFTPPNKRGASVDNMYAMILFFGMTVFVLIFALLWSTVKDVDVIWSQAQHGQTIKDRGQQFVDTLDFYMFMAYIGLHLVVIALAFLLRTHPVLFVVGLLFNFILLLVSPVLSNQYVTLSANAEFSAVIADFPIMTFIMERLPFLELLWIILTLILTYGFASGGGDI